MKYDLKKPCTNCPFLRSEKRVNLRYDRIAEIHNYMTAAQGGSFPCHKTVEHDDDDGEYVPRPGEQHCLGGLIYALAQGSPNQLTRVALRLGVVDADELLKHKGIVFSSLGEWQRHAVDYKNAASARDEVISCSIAESSCEAPAGYISGDGIVEGDESAEYECYECGEPVCGPCSRPRKRDGRVRRICVYCTGEES